MKLTIRELTVFSMLGAVTYASKVLMEALPNIHLVGVFIIAFTLVYRRKALYPIYVYVFLTGLLMDLIPGGFPIYTFGHCYGEL